MTMPAAEIQIEAALARLLLRAQHPDLAGLPLRRVGEGWDNVTYRLGAELALRLPRRAIAAPLIANEQTWLPRLAPYLPLPVPAPVRSGSPGQGFPHAWSIVPWIPGRAVAESRLRSSEGGRWASFLRALHSAPDTDLAPHNPYRSVPLAERDQIFTERLYTLDLDPGPILRRWRAACAAAPAACRVWLHSDLHGHNVLAHRGALAGVIDWGDVCAGDPACDLDSVWTLFAEPAVRERILSDYGADQAEVLRAQGWVLNYVVMVLASDDAVHAPMARAALARLQL